MTPGFATPSFEYILQVVNKVPGGDPVIANRLRYETKEELRKGIKMFSITALKEMNQEDLNQIDRIEIILPMRDNAVIENKNITIVDMPGIEDALCLRKMLTYIEDNRYKIVPMFVIDMTQGTLNLV